ncbi:MAG: TRAP transporter small permease subunit [Deltaproteobacteria bacterium]|nr:TRAP transporter small permease subunit [Deltaproteobacteria bacterium]
MSFLILVLAIVIGYEVLMRYGFDSPTVWVHELSVMLLGTAMIISGAFTSRYNGHMSMDIVYGMFPRRGRVILDIVTSFLLTLPFVVVLLWFGGERAWRSLITLEHDSTQWGPPIYPFIMMLPVGAFLLFLQTLAKLVRDFIILFSGKREE